MKKLLTGVVVVYVPVSKDAPEFGIDLCDVAGGYTSHIALGAWCSPENEVIEEAIKVYRVLYADSQYSELQAVVSTEVNRLLASGEEVVLVEHNDVTGVMFSIP